MRRAAQWLLNAVQWTSFGCWSLLWMTAAILHGLIFRNDPHTPLSWARRYWGSGLVRIAQATIVQHPGFVPEPGKPYFFAMNHQSLFDIVAAFVCIPENLRFVAKKSLRAIPFLGWYMSVTGMVFIDRKNHQSAVRSLDEACQKIRDGISILVYPEGTRSPDGSILPFKKGPFVMAIQAGVPIVPLAIEGSYRIVGRGSARLSPATVHFKAGEPIPTAGLTLDDRDRLMQKVRDALIDLHVSIGGRGGDKLTTVSPEGAEGKAGRGGRAGRPGALG